jgi:ComF family protein
VTLRGLADTLLSVLLAPPCAVCDRVLERPLDGAVCDACWTAIEAHPSPFSLPTIATAAAVGLYESTLRDVIHAFKYEGRRSIAPRLSALMLEHGGELLHGVDLVVPVALHPRRRRQRGFNQADDLARGLGLPVSRVLKRVRATRPQVDLPAEKRRENVKDAFALRRGALTQLPGRRVVLVDDVATTGATLESCARALRAAGVAEIRALTAARVASAPPQTRRA